jgi:hypothetical protein
VPAVWTTGHAPNSGTKTCTVAWPDGGVSDLSGNLFEWTATPVLFASLAGGGAASVSSTGTAGQMKIAGMVNIVTAGAVPGDVITLTGANTASTNGTFAIISVIDQTSAVVTKTGFAATGGTDTKNGTITWSLINTYYKTRGGAYGSPRDGTSCEFDFDIARPTFTNADIGFRCCFDARP